MPTGYNFEIAFGFIIKNIIADMTFKLTKQVRVDNFVEFIFESKYREKSFLTEKILSS